MTQRFGRSAVFLAAGDYHHHLGLNTWEKRFTRPLDLDKFLEE